MKELRKSESIGLLRMLEEITYTELEDDYDVRDALVIGAELDLLSLRFYGTTSI